MSQVENPYAPPRTVESAGPAFGDSYTRFAQMVGAHPFWFFGPLLAMAVLSFGFTRFVPMPSDQEQLLQWMLGETAFSIAVQMALVPPMIAAAVKATSPSPPSFPAAWWRSFGFVLAYQLAISFLLVILCPGFILAALVPGLWNLAAHVEGRNARVTDWARMRAVLPVVLVLLLVGQVLPAVGGTASNPAVAVLVWVGDATLTATSWWLYVAASRVYETGAVEVFVPATDGREVWTANGQLVFRKGATLPARCVWCNGPADVWIKRNAYWHPPAYYLLIFLNLLIYAMVAAFVRKRARFEMPICKRHQHVRWAGAAASLGGAALSVAMLVVAIPRIDSDAGDGLAVAAAFLFLASIFPVGLTRGPAVRKIDDRCVWLGKVSPDYLLDVTRT